MAGHSLTMGLDRRIAHGACRATKLCLMSMQKMKKVGGHRDLRVHADDDGDDDAQEDDDEFDRPNSLEAEFRLRVNRELYREMQELGAVRNENLAQELEAEIVKHFTDAKKQILEDPILLASDYIALEEEISSIKSDLADLKAKNFADLKEKVAILIKNQDAIWLLYIIVLVVFVSEHVFK